MTHADRVKRNCTPSFLDLMLGEWVIGQLLTKREAMVTEAVRILQRIAFQHTACGKCDKCHVTFAHSLMDCDQLWDIFEVLPRAKSVGDFLGNQHEVYDNFHGGYIHDIIALNNLFYTIWLEAAEKCGFTTVVKLIKEELDSEL